MVAGDAGKRCICSVEQRRLHPLAVTEGLIYESSSGNNAKRAEIRSDGYPMSIGELINLYRDGELDIHPEFQRFYRWNDEQKSRLIESILLGIPIPYLQFLYLSETMVFGT